MKIAINGFGRIGRNVFKIAFEDKDMEVVAINDLTDPKTLAHLLKYDSTYGVYAKSVQAKEDAIVVDGKEIKIYAVRNPAELPWKELGVDIAIESTGVFAVAESPKGGYKDHIKAGAKKVILTVPAKDKIDQTIVCGVNDDDLDLSNDAFSNASCTTNCLAPVVKVLNDSFGIERGLMTTVHAFTNDQVTLDMPHKDLRRARSASLSIIPLRTGSFVDLTVMLEKDCTVEELNAAVKAAAEGPMKGILEYTEDPIVSSDIKGNSHSSIFDSALTMKMGPKFFKVMSWYDNEMGYSNRVVDLAKKLKA